MNPRTIEIRRTRTFMRSRRRHSAERYAFLGRKWSTPFAGATVAGGIDGTHEARSDHRSGDRPLSRAGRPSETGRVAVSTWCILTVCHRGGVGRNGSAFWQ